MRFEHGQSRYGRYARVSKAQRGRLVIYVVLLVGVLVAMYALRGQSKTGPIKWLANFEKAQAQAKSDGKPIMAFFYVEGNAECQRMENETFADKDVRAQAQKFVCVRLDGKARPELVKRYLMVEVYPSVAFISPDGGPVWTVLNRWPPEDFLGEMQAALQPRKPPDIPPGQADADELTESPTLPPKNAEPSRGGAE